MSATFKTEAVVLRSIRYGEADRVLHLYSRERGRIGAMAKGVRRIKSRFGGRLEPLFRVDLLLHEGRGELYTVTSVDTVDAHPALRERREAIERATQACDAVLRLLDSQEPGSATHDRLRGGSEAKVCSLHATRRSRTCAWYSSVSAIARSA